MMEQRRTYRTTTVWVGIFDIAGLLSMLKCASAGVMYDADLHLSM